jgi:hypothetical protein
VLFLSVASSVEKVDCEGVDDEVKEKRVVEIPLISRNGMNRFVRENTNGFSKTLVVNVNDLTGYSKLLVEN